MDKKITKKRITGSLPVKIAVFILMILCVGVAMFAGYGTIFALSEEVYEKPYEQQLEDAYFSQARIDQYRIYDLIANGRAERIEDYCRGRNICVEIFNSENDMALWSNYDPEADVWADTYVYEYEGFPPVDRENLPVLQEEVSEVRLPVTVGVDEEDGGGVQQEEGTGQNIRIVLYVNKNLEYVDEYYNIWQLRRWLFSTADQLPIVAGVTIFAALICFIFLMCSAGHRNEQQDGGGASFGDADNDPADGNETVDFGAPVPDVSPVIEGNRIYPGVLHGIWLDVLLALLFAIVAFITYITGYIIADYSSLKKTLLIDATALTAWAMITAFFVTLFCMELAIRIKRGGFLKYTLIYTVLSFVEKCIKAVGRGILTVFTSLPVLVPSIVAFTALSVCEFIGLCIWGEAELVVIWFFERILIMAVIFYFGLARGKLQKAGKALAEGNLSYHVDTSKMILGYKEHGNYLNSIGEGMAKAVAERMKSEHLKTELISNVSHDLKTPLTSIINYSDLLGQAGTEPEKVKEYTEVLHRQSIRLKKLLDDLLEVSKASTGNLSTDLAPCDIKVLITQTTGEYEQRFAEKNLELIHQEPKEDVHIMADHRHLFRIFDNLLGNIYKYAQPGSRVYLNVEKEEKKVRIVFRNMSEYPLNVNGGELMERFVRGDKSRHKEGNGLGLSIAMSLAQLQGGSLQIITDGDLFKAVLEFPMQQG